MNSNSLSIQIRFAALDKIETDNDNINLAWERSKQALQETCQETLGFIQHKRKNWISDDTWNKIEERRILKEKVLASKTNKRGIGQVQ